MRRRSTDPRRFGNRRGPREKMREALDSRQRGAHCMGMRISKHTDGDVIVTHAAGVSLSDAHAAAKAIDGVRILDTFRDGWGRIVSRGVAGRSFAQIDAQAAA